MSHLNYELGCARHDDLLREAASRRKAADLRCRRYAPGSGPPYRSASLLTRLAHVLGLGRPAQAARV